MTKAPQYGCRLRLNVCLLAIFSLFFPFQTLAQRTNQTRAMTAVQIEVESIRLDGELDEPEWDLSEVAKDFTQNEPFAGQPATEPTEVRVLYDRANLFYFDLFTVRRVDQLPLIPNLSIKFESR